MRPPAASAMARAGASGLPLRSHATVFERPCEKDAPAGMAGDRQYIRPRSRLASSWARRRASSRARRIGS